VGERENMGMRGEGREGTRGIQGLTEERAEDQRKRVCGVLTLYLLPRVPFLLWPIGDPGLLSPG
jgi:hypothetical protein